jgi:hypothetical protein
MKTLFILLMFPLFALSQSDGIDASFRIGMNTKPLTAIVGAGIDFKAHGFAISPEMIVDVNDDQPANFGLKISYGHKVMENVSLRAGVGYFYQLYTMDKYDSYKNGYRWNYFFSAQWERLFGMAEYMNGLRLSVGVKIKILNPQ